MSIDRRNIFVIEGGKALELWQQRQNALKKESALRKAFKDEIGAESLMISEWGSRSPIVGAVFQSDRPGWRYDRKRGFYVPRLSTKAGKVIAKRLESLTVSKPTGHDFFSRDAEYIDGIGGRFYLCPPYVGVLAKGSDVVIVTVHKRCNAEPIDGLRPIKHSEYYAMLEAAEQAAASRAERVAS